MSEAHNKDMKPDFRTYLSSREAVLLWLSLATIFAFFIFSFIPSENVLILFVKRASALGFAFLAPGYVITKTIYPEKIDPTERFAFSIAFSVAFVMLTSYILNYVAITHFSLAITTFSLALIFTFIAVLRTYRTCEQKQDLRGSGTSGGGLVPLALMGLLVFLIKIYPPLTEPRAGFVDTYIFSIYTLKIISSGAAISTTYPFSTGYAPGYFFITTFLTFFLDMSVYDVMRYAHVFSFLTIVPAYLFARHVFKSRHIAILAITFLFSTRWVFMRTSISNAESMSHFFVILFLFTFLKTIENPTLKNCLVTSLILSSTVLEYHMTLQFLIPFIFVIFIFLTVRHLLTKASPNLKGIIKIVSLAVVPAVLISGGLWYFWNLDTFFYGRPAATYLARGISTQLILSKGSFIDLTYHIRHIGLFETIALFTGLALVASHSEHRKNIRYQFLIIYLAVLLFLIQSKFFGIKGLHVWYMLSWLAFPASMLAGYGLFNVASIIRTRLIGPDTNIPSTKIFLVLGIMLIILINFNGFNYHWYKHDTSKIYPFDKRISPGPWAYRSLQESVSENGFLSSYIYRGYYGFYHPISITMPEYTAFKEIKERTAPNSLILLWKCKRSYVRAVGERSTLALEGMEIKPDYSPMMILKKNIEYKFNKELFTTNGSVAKYNSIDWAQLFYAFPGGLDTNKYRFFEMRFKVDNGRMYVGVYDSQTKRHEFMAPYSTGGKWETYRLDLYEWLKVRGYGSTIYGITLNGNPVDDPSFNATIDWISINNGAGVGFKEDFADTTYWMSYLDNQSLLKDRFLLVGLEGEFPYGTCLTFSNETRASLVTDPNFRLIYQNEQIKIYNITRDYTLSLNKPGGFMDDFVDTFYWGVDLNERVVLRTDGDIATYQTLDDNRPIDVDFSTGLDTKAYPYFETLMKVDSGKLSIGVYDSTGDVHVFLENYTTDGKWETYKFNLNSWLAKNGYETDVYGIKITGVLDGDQFFRSSFNWISIHNHIFWDAFDDEGKIVDMDNISVVSGDVTLSKMAAEIIKNSGFENGSEDWRLGAKWNIDGEKFHSGNRSAVLQGTVDPSDDPSAYLDTNVYPKLLKPNTTYRFSVWITGNVSDAIMGRIRQSGSEEPWSKWMHFTADDEGYDNWTYSEEILTTPADVTGDFWIRIYGGGDPAVWIDDISFGEDTYVPSGTLTSAVTNTKNPIVSVTPSWTSTEADGRSITIKVSVDNGATWTVAKNGVSINYPANDANRHLMYRAYLQTDDVYTSPILQDITLTYEEQSDTT